LESKSSDLATPSYLDQSRPNLKIWTPTRLNLMAVTLARGNEKNLIGSNLTKYVESQNTFWVPKRVLGRRIMITYLESFVKN